MRIDGEWVNRSRHDQETEIDNGGIREVSETGTQDRIVARGLRDFAEGRERSRDEGSERE